MRSHLRGNEQLTYYFCADYALTFLEREMPGVRVEQVDAFNITTEAGSMTQRRRQAVLDGYRQVLEAGEKITAAAIASTAGISQGRISQIAAIFEGWAALKKLLGFLYNSLYSNTNNLEEPDPDIKWLAQTYLPLCLDSGEATLDEVAQLVKVEGGKGFETLLRAATVETKAKLLGVLVALLPPELHPDWQWSGG